VQKRSPVSIARRRYLRLHEEKKKNYSEVAEGKKISHSLKKKISLPWAEIRVKKKLERGKDLEGKNDHTNPGKATDTFPKRWVPSGLRERR